MRTRRDCQLEIKEGPYKVIVTALREYGPDSRGKMINGFRRVGVITRIDGAPVYDNNRMYSINHGSLFTDIDSAIEDGDQVACKAIADGFASK